MSQVPQMLPLGDEELEVPVYEDGGEVKSDVHSLLGTIHKTGYSVVFQRIFEVHGNMSEKTVDNATLLVIKISPRVGGDKRQFKRFEISLELETVLAPGGPRNASPPEFKSYEPAQEGVWFIKERTVARTESGEIEGNASAHVAGGLTLGFTAKKAVSEEEERRILHTVKAEPDYIRTGEFPDKVTWRLSPADNADGVGDYMAVALLIKRHKRAQFRIKVDSKARLGFVSDASNIWPGRNLQYLGPFGPAPHDDTVQQRKPEGVDETKLGALSEKNLLQTFAFVHIPEKVEPRAIYSKEATVVPVAQSPILSPPAPTAPVPSPRPVIRDSLSSTIAEHQVDAGTRPRLKDTPETQGARARRHRKMAALYQRLAELHREEADEAERVVGELYADEAERDELD